AHLDRPNDISFGCAANQTQADNAIITVALPASACAGIAVAPDAGTAPLPDAGALTAAFPLAFVIEATRGDLSVGNLSGTGSFVDSDVFAPGLNGIPVGRLPVGVVTNANGCHAVVANSGSCDLAMVHVAHALLAHPNAI